jgi:molybdenum cofactor cytidylyltransferase
VGVIPGEIVQLIRALRVQQPTSIAFVGAGGKTTALFQVARELRENEKTTKTILLTTSTHLGAWQTGSADHWFAIHSASDIQRLGEALPGGIVLLTGIREDDRMRGLSLELLECVHQLAITHNLPLLIEADGAHMLPLKAPANNEPVIPHFVNAVVVVAGLMSLGKPLSAARVHRPELFGKLAGIQEGDLVTAEALASVLLSERGGLKNIPGKARKIVLLNQADSVELQVQARVLADRLIKSFDSVAIAALQKDSTEENNHNKIFDGSESSISSVVERTSGIILAAGGSSRFGQPKQLLTWRGQPLIRHVAEVAIEEGLQPVVVVLGASASEIEPVIKELPLRIVINSEWPEGISSSIKAGLQVLPQNCGAAIFFQADQPQIPSELIKLLVETHQKRLDPIVAPIIRGQRGNPVLFDASTFPVLLELEGDIGGRALFKRFLPRWVEWDDTAILVDVDSPEDYQKLLHLYRDAQGEG